ncbi:CHAP domain-containing protein [Olivibacter sitiensis]|uniref:CHAP domain-containing protein n=1 Tax=Olivibacter sitiensis TaxID=376470 RepID=UPI00068735C7|nr:CHAP domain-containing protein [Olivibacter sitiensis]
MKAIIMISYVLLGLGIALGGAQPHYTVVVVRANSHSPNSHSPQNPLQQKIRDIYTAEIGVREATGKNDGSRVEAYLRYCGLGKGNAWCAAFVSWVYGQAGLKEPRTAWAAALFPKAKQVQLSAIGSGHSVARSPSQGATQNAQQSLGLVFGIYYPSLGRIGHCGFVDGVEGSTLITVEGNTNEVGSREGDGVYRKRRPIKTIHALADWLPPLSISKQLH